MISISEYLANSSCYRAVGVAAIVLLAGCGNESGFYDLSGTLQLNGEDVPKALIIFSPDRSNGNSGSQGLVMVSEGEIIEVVRPVVGGPHWMEVQLYDGVPYEDVEGTVTMGRRLLPSQHVQLELPLSDAELVVNVQGQEDEEITVGVEILE